MALLSAYSLGDIVIETFHCPAGNPSLPLLSTGSLLLIFADLAVGHVRFICLRTRAFIEVCLVGEVLSYVNVRHLRPWSRTVSGGTPINKAIIADK